MTAAQGEKYADDAIGNVTGSNSVNVFLGLGIPWIIGTAYEAAVNGRGYYVAAGPLGFSVVVFLICAVICIITLMLRRIFIGAELGGPKCSRVTSMIWLMLLWGIYITMCILQAYEIGGLHKIDFGIKQPLAPKIDQKCVPYSYQVG